MPNTALVVFTARPIESILHDRGFGNWRLDAARARRCEFLICTQNRHNPDFGAPTAPHRAAFLIGHISGVVPSEEANRWELEISDYAKIGIPNIWAKFGHLRYPVWYTSLEELGIDFATLPPFTPLPPVIPGAPAAAGFTDVSAGFRPMPMTPRTTDTAPHVDGDVAWRRLDAILAQIDRVPDLPTPTDPLDWDAHGLPR